MLNWLVRPIMLVAAVIAGWFVAEDSANFGVVQLVISVILVTGLVALATFLPSIVDRVRGRRTPKQE